MSARKTTRRIKLTVHVKTDSPPKPKKKYNTGRPEAYVDWKQFEALCGIRCTLLEICNILRVSSPTLENAVKRKYNEPFLEVFARFHSGSKASLRRSIYQEATGYEVPCTRVVKKKIVKAKDQSEETYVPVRFMMFRPPNPITQKMLAAQWLNWHDKGEPEEPETPETKPVKWVILGNNNEEIEIETSEIAKATKEFSDE